MSSIKCLIISVKTLRPEVEDYWLEVSADVNTVSDLKSTVLDTNGFILSAEDIDLYLDGVVLRDETRVNSNVFTDRDSIEVKGKRGRQVVDTCTSMSVEKHYNSIYPDNNISESTHKHTTDEDIEATDVFVESHDSTTTSHTSQSSDEREYREPMASKTIYNLRSRRMNTKSTINYCETDGSSDDNHTDISDTETYDDWHSGPHKQTTNHDKRVSSNELNCIQKSDLISNEITDLLKKQFVCDYAKCGKSFTRYSHLCRHKHSVHFKEKPFVCNYKNCGKNFTRNELLVAHKKYTHLQIRPFVCGYNNCGKRFPKNIKLTYHRRTHTGEKPHVCDYKNCGQTFTSNHELNRHTKIKHLGLMRYYCTYQGCSKYFSAIPNLNRHKRAVHLREKPYVCNHPGCGKYFSREDNMFQHKRIIHMGMKRFICDYKGCRKKFMLNKSLVRHKRVEHLGENPI
ncbi:unnamed protein product [Oppiella nova]|uniref:C2H2-type domain-containing protein n=1 Tax=Oppiella nova TaxID=334625 RepID=A0A7R9LM97_9ACAR|nr:unnamed protein product [Oppiella nova]CAG2164948.1 unnamed protein product [Oppiella nova]